MLETKFPTLTCVCADLGTRVSEPAVLGGGAQVVGGGGGRGGWG